MKGRCMAWLLMCLCTLCGAQRLQRVQLPTQNELPIPIASCVAVDDEGFMWIGTIEGLFRSDGYHVYPFRWSDELPPAHNSDYVTRIADDHRGHLWVGTIDGMYFIDKHNGYHKDTLGISENKGDVTALLTANDSTIWAAIGDMVVHLSSTGEVLHKIKCKWQSDGYKWVCDIKQGGDGRIYLAQSHGGLWLVDNNGLTPLPYDSPYEAQTMECDSRHGGAWIGSWGGGILWYDGKHAMPASTSKPNTGNSAMVIHLQLSPGCDTLWATTMQGLEAYAIHEAGLLEPIDLSSLELSDRQILCFMGRDWRTNDLWVSGNNPTTFAVQKAPAMPSHTAEGSIADVDAVCYSAPYIYTWHNRRGLSIHKRGDNDALTTLYDGNSTVESSFMSPDNEGGCYFGRTATNGSQTVISHISVIDNKVKKNNVCVIDGNISALHYVKATQTLWVATGDCVWRIYGQRPSKAFHAKECAINCMAVSCGCLYLGTDRGLMVSDASGNSVQQLCRQQVKCMASQGDTCLWMGTVSGQVLRLGSDGIIREVAGDAMPLGGGVYHIAVDSAGHVWTHSMRHLCEYSPATGCQRVLAADSRQIGMTYINTLCPVENGIMAGGIGGGAVWLEPTQKLEQAAAPVLQKIKVSMVLADGETSFPSPADSVLTVKAGVTSIVLHLTTLNHVSPQTVTFAYRLCSGSNEGVWTTLPTGQNMVYLSTLPHGRWTIEAKAADSELLWSEAVTVMTIDSLPHWWQTWWAIVLFAAVIAACTLASLQLWRNVSRIKQMYRKATEKRHRVFLESVETAVPVATDSDQDFMQRAVAIVEQHIADSDYAVETLASDLCMSRMTLYRRLQGLTGQTPSEFMRAIRLKYAARILKSHPGMNVADVAAATGFSTPAVFRRQFKAMFGVTPSDYQ